MEILILHASAGAGHKRAAEALYQGIKAKTNYHATIIDALDYTSVFFKKTYAGAYVFLVTCLPWLWQFFFSLSDLPWLTPVVRLCRRIYNGINARSLVRLITQTDYDYIITTHFLSSEVAGYLKLTGKTDARIITVVTDFDVHRIWINPGVDLFCVASDFTKQRLVQKGVSEDKIRVTGIPVDEKFSRHVDVAQLRETLKLDQDLFTVLIATGSFGFGPIEQLIHQLDKHQLLVVCGHNVGLYQKLSESHPDRVHVYGFVHNMEDLMAAADCMITKPGGLSISEGLTAHLPLIFFSAIPGQETNNVRVLDRYGVGKGLCSLPEIITKVKELSSSKDALRTAREDTKRLAKPEAVKNIIELLSVKA